MTLDITGLLGSLGFTADEHVGILAIGRDGSRQSAVRPLGEVADYLAELDDDLNVFFSVNPVTGPARDNDGRGKAEDVTRVAAFAADFDIKPGGCKDIATSLLIVAEISAVIGKQPTAITYSGHGIHAYWAVSDGAITDTGDAAAILKRFGRLVKSIGQMHGARLDSVFDLPRVLRAPGTFNNKDVGQPGIPVRTVAADGNPIALAEVAATLDTHKFPELDGDRRLTPSKIVSGSATWAFAKETCPYVREMVDGLDNDGPAFDGDGRHQWAGNQANRFTAAWRLGCISEEDWGTAQSKMDARLCDLRAVTGESTPASEIPGWFEWAIENVEHKSDADTRQELRDHKHAKPIDEEFFWESCDELRNLRQFARARRVGPWAMFGAVCAIVTAAVPPHVVLPPLVGSYATLNTFVALVAPSGAIKSAAIRAAYDWLRLDPEPNVKKPGSGEGLAKCFAYKGKVDNEIRQVGKAWSVVAEITEVDALIATGGRGGSTLMSELRSAWSGERLGFDYAGQDKAITLEGHRYRLTMLVGVQPKRSGPLFEDADGGTPQRFIWLPTTDPNPPNLRPQEPAPLTLDLPGRFDPRAGDGKLLPDRNMRRRAELDTPADRTGFRVIGVPKAVEDAVESRTLAALTGTENGDALDGHKLLCREKLAAFIAILRGHNDAITEQDWELSEVVMAVSDRTRQETQKVLSVEAERRNKSAGKSQGIRKIAEANVIADAQVQRIKDVGEKVCAKLSVADGKSMSGADLKRQVRGIRENFDDVLGYLEDEGRAVVETVQYQGQPGIRVTLLVGPEQTV